MILTRIHVNRHNVQRNKKGENLPPFTVKDYQRNRKGYAVHMSGPSTLVYEPQRPLKSGAIAWIETTEPVQVFDEKGHSVT